MNRSGIILFAHGARDPEWARPFARVRALLERRAPTTPIELAFLEAWSAKDTAEVFSGEIRGDTIVGEYRNFGGTARFVRQP